MRITIRKLEDGQNLVVVQRTELTESPTQKRRVAAGKATEDAITEMVAGVKTPPSPTVP